MTTRNLMDAYESYAKARTRFEMARHEFHWWLGMSRERPGDRTGVLGVSLLQPLKKIARDLDEAIEKERPAS